LNERFAGVGIARRHAGQQGLVRGGPHQVLRPGRLIGWGSRTAYLFNHRPRRAETDG
jgi:hypothetical protein